jgi:hypothetical protein
MQKEHREQRSLLRAPEIDLPTIVEHLERTQHAEFHQLSVARL